MSPTTFIAFMNVRKSEYSLWSCEGRIYCSSVRPVLCWGWGESRAAARNESGIAGDKRRVSTYRRHQLYWITLVSSRCSEAGRLGDNHFGEGKERLAHEPSRSIHPPVGSVNRPNTDGAPLVTHTEPLAALAIPLELQCHVARPSMPQ